MDSLLFPLLMAISLIGLTVFLFLRSGSRSRLPPGPRPLPIIGNIHQLGKKPYETLRQMAKTYGPLMSIYQGSKYTVVVSSPEMAKEILQRHGQVFSGRSIPEVMHIRDHSKLSLVFIPTEKAWREKRKMCKEMVFSERCLEGSEALRQEKLQQLVEHVGRHSDRGDVVDIHDVVFVTNLNLTLTTLFSTSSSDFESDTTKEFKKLVKDIFAVTSPTLNDFFPILKTFDPQGIKRKAESYLGKLFSKFDDFLDQRLDSRRNNPGAPKELDLLETLIDITQGNDYNLTTQQIPNLLIDLFLGGIDSNTIMIEWIMTELLFHPDKLKKLKEEIKSVVGEKGQIREADIARLPYLQAVIKETFRYHPPGPLLIPRISEADQEVNGHMIPKGTQILFNVWAMGKDPSIWTDPETFKPERFLEKKVDFKGQHFELIPFGAGRRICPGMPLATRILQMTTAVLVHNFEWKLEKDKDHQDHKGEVFVMALRRETPLRAFPFKI